MGNVPAHPQDFSGGVFVVPDGAPIPSPAPGTSIPVGPHHFLYNPSSGDPSLLNHQTLLLVSQDGTSTPLRITATRPVAPRLTSSDAFLAHHHRRTYRERTEEELEEDRQHARNVSQREQDADLSLLYDVQQQAAAATLLAEMRNQKFDNIEELVRAAAAARSAGSSPRVRPEEETWEAVSAERLQARLAAREREERAVLSRSRSIEANLNVFPSVAQEEADDEEATSKKFAFRRRAQTGPGPLRHEQQNTRSRGPDPLRQTERGRLLDLSEVIGTASSYTQSSSPTSRVDMRKSAFDLPEEQPGGPPTTAAGEARRSSLDRIQDDVQAASEILLQRQGRETGQTRQPGATLSAFSLHKVWKANAASSGVPAFLSRREAVLYGLKSEIDGHDRLPGDPDFREPCLRQRDLPPPKSRQEPLLAEQQLDDEDLEIANQLMRQRQIGRLNSEAPAGLKEDGSFDHQDHDRNGGPKRRKQGDTGQLLSRGGRLPLSQQRLSPPQNSDGKRRVVPRTDQPVEYAQATDSLLPHRPAHASEPDDSRVDDILKKQGSHRPARVANARSGTDQGQAMVLSATEETAPVRCLPTGPASHAASRLAHSSPNLSAGINSGSTSCSPGTTSPQSRNSPVTKVFVSSPPGSFSISNVEQGSLLTQSSQTALYFKEGERLQQAIRAAIERQKLSDTRKRKSADSSPSPDPPDATEDADAARPAIRAKNCDDDLADPLPTDILCGKDQRYKHHHGNQIFRAMIQLYQDVYAGTNNKQDRMGITKEIVWLLKTQNKSRFVKWVAAEQTWQELNDQQARDKVSHALRTANSAHQHGRKSPRPGKHHASQLRAKAKQRS